MYLSSWRKDCLISNDRGLNVTTDTDNTLNTVTLRQFPESFHQTYESYLGRPNPVPYTGKGNEKTFRTSSDEDVSER